MKKITQAYFQKTLNDVRSLLHRSGVAKAHVEEICCLLLMELAVDYHEGSRVRASKYLQDLGYRLGARIRDPGRTDIASGEYRPSIMERVIRWLRIDSKIEPAMGELKEPDVPIAESKPRLIVPPPSRSRS